jgi:hypothetical protein
MLRRIRGRYREIAAVRWQMRLPKPDEEDANARGAPCIASGSEDN